MPDETIYSDSLCKSLFLYFDVAGLSDSLGQPFQLSEYADEALRQASRYGQIELVVYFLASGADVNASDELCYTPLHKALTFGNDQVCFCCLQLELTPVLIS
jgi:ankyrin repeat protein